MADVFDFYVKDNRTIQFDLTEPIMLEDSHVSDWVFHIPRVLNNIDMSGWAWWLVYINARGQKYSELLELSEDPESPLEKCIATYSVDYGMSIKAGTVRFSLEAINTDTGGEILNEWHTQTYQAKVQDTLQGNQVEFAETESDIISALIIEVQNKVAQLVGGATPEPVSLIADMTDTKKVYLYVGSETGESTNYWYYYNGSAWVAGGVYAGGITVDSVPTQGSANAVSSGGVYDALDTLQAQIPQIDSTLSQSGQAADAKKTGDEITGLKEDLTVIENQLDTGIELVSARWAVGSLWSSSGHYNNSVSNRVATVDMFTVSEAKTYIIDSGWQVGVAVFDSSDTLQNAIAWKTGSLLLATNTLYRLIVARRSEITGETAVVSEFVQHIHKVSNIQAQFNALSENDDSIDAKLEQINQVIKSGYRVISSSQFVQGGFNSAGLTSNTTTRIRPNALIPVEVGAKIHVIPNGQEFAVGLWTENMVIYRNDNSFSTQESTITISTKGYAIVVIRKSDNSTIVPSELTAELQIYDVNKINSIDAIIDEKLADVEQGMPDYWKTYMETKILDVRSKDALIGADGDAFIFVTDMHISASANGKQYNALNSPSVIKYITKNSGVRWLVNGGDTIELYTGSKQNALSGLQMWQKMVYGIEEYCVPGNHDSNNFNGTNADYALTYQDFYALMDRPIERIINTNSQTYFCMDNESQKIRYIFCATDLYDNLADQIAFLKSALTEKDNTWTILVIQHKLFNDDNSGYHNQAVPFINAINEVYSQIQGTFIGVLAGHTHSDYASYESVNGYALISTTTDAWRLQASSQGLTRTVGTYTEQAFDIVHISKTNQIVYLTRIGAGSDRTIPFRA